MMENIIFLNIYEVLEIHNNMIEKYGGDHGIRDLSLLQSALSMPQSGVADQYFHQDIYEMAAAYLFHIVKNHPFVDGNKRTGVTAALIFLYMNDILIKAKKIDLESIVFSIVDGKIGKESVSVFFRKNFNSRLCAPEKGLD